MKKCTRVLVSGTLLSAMIAPSFGAYVVKRGDSLSLISKYHYGTFDKWPDLWSINRDKVKNPDLIYPGWRLRLLEMAKVASSETNTIQIPSKRSQEWRLLPLQPWEQFTFLEYPAVDPDGFDRRSKVTVRTADRATANITIESDRIPIAGEVVAARSEFARMFIGEQIMIHADEPLQVGSTYAVTPGPEKLISRRDGRVGFGYQINGRVRVIGVREGVFIGTILSISSPILRNQLLIPDVAPLIFPEPVEADQPMAATVMVPEEEKENLLGAQHIVFLDVGLNDGIKPGMIFRQFVHTDPFTNEKISSKDFIIESELQVLRAHDQFSIAVILNSLSNMRDGDEVIALTDLADFYNHNGLQTVIQERGQIKAVDDLDKMDVTEGLGEKENKELRQLEKWNKPTPEAPPILDDEIKKVIPENRNKRGMTELGNELAPNDGSDQGITEPETAPIDPAPTPADIPMAPPETAPEPEAPPANDAPPLMGDETPSPIPEAIPEATPEEIPMDVPSDIPADEPANGVPSGEDPFATPAPPEP